MHYYIISEGRYEIEHIYFGATKDEVVEKVRPMINRWEYKAMGNEEVIDFYNHRRFYEILGYKNISGEYKIKSRKGEGFLNWARKF